MARPSILYVTCHLPYPPIGGGRRRDYELIRRLATDFNLSLCVLSKTPEEDERNAPALREHASPIKVLPVGSPECHGGERVAHHVWRHRSLKASQWVNRLLLDTPVELVHVEGYYLLQHVPSLCRVPILLVEENVEYVLFRQAAANEPDPVRQQQLEQEALLTESAERAAWRRSSLCGAVSSHDRAHMRSAMPGLDVRLTPDGADHLDGEPPTELTWVGSSGSRDPSFVFVGNFSYEPNVDAAIYLCRDIFPLVQAVLPNVRLLLVGANGPRGLQELARATDGVSLIGPVVSVVPYLDAVDAVVCPLRIGGGVKVKSLEAIRRGKAIVTTSIGMQGIDPAVAGCVELRDDAAGMALALVSILSSEEKRRSLERAALAFAGTLPSWDDAAAAVVGCYKELIAGPGRRLTSAGSDAGKAPPVGEVEGSLSARRHQSADGGG